MFLVVLLYALLALTFTLGKYSINFANPLFLISVRMVIAGVLLLIALTVRRVSTKKSAGFDQITWRDISDFAQVTLFHIYLSFVPEFWAFEYVSSIKVNIMYATTPFIALLFSYLLYGERVKFSQLIGTVVGFVGLLPLMASGDSFCIKELVSFSLPELMLLVSITSSAYAWFVIKRLMQRGYSLFAINGTSMLLGGCMSFLTWYIAYGGQSPVYNPFYFMVTVGGLIILSNVIVYNMYGWLLQFYSVNFVACAGFLSPVFGAIYGRFFLGEHLGWQHMWAIACITLGLYLFFKDELYARRQRRREAAVTPAAPTAS